jgi:hypothetical protein
VARFARLAPLALLGALFGVAVWIELPLCPLAGTFGIPCPGCGLTRATLALLRGDLRGALELHPLVWLLTPLFVGFSLAMAWELVRDPAQARRKSLIGFTGRGTNAMLIGVLALSISVWLARFAGYFGGPAPVITLREWMTHAREHRHVGAAPSVPSPPH